MYQVIKNRYRPLQVIHESKIGIAYIGEDVELKTPLLIQSYNCEFFPHKAVEALQVTAGNLIGIHHPHIIPVIDYFYDEKIFYTISPYANEQTIDMILGHIRNFTLQQTLPVIEIIIKAVQYAHYKNIVHGTINDTNVVLLDNGQTAIKGFALEHIINAVLIEKNIIVANAAYLAPEQLKGEKATPLCDIFGIGAVMYRLLTGNPPFSGDQNAIRLMNNLSTNPIKPTLLNADIPKSIEAIILKCLQKEPSMRYKAPLEIWRDIEMGVTPTVPHMRPGTTTDKEVYNKESEVGRPLAEEYDIDMIGDKLPKIDPKAIQKGWKQVTGHPHIKKTAKKVLNGVDTVITKIENYVNEEPQPRSSRKQKTFQEKFFLFVMVGLVCGIAFATIQAFVFLYFTSIPTVAVPDVTGKLLADGVEQIESIGLRFKIAGVAYKADMPPDYIYYQVPDAGRMVKKNRPVKIFLSKGAGDMSVPSIVGQKIAQVYGNQQKMKIAVVVKEEVWDARVPAGEIISQDPPPGVPMNPGISINVVVSKGFPITITIKDESESEKVLVMSMTVPSDWLPQKVKIISEGDFGQRTVFEKEIFPGQTEYKQLIESADAVLSVFYNDELKFKRELKNFHLIKDEKKSRPTNE